MDRVRLRAPELEWLQAEQPAFIGRLRRLVERDQVEILGGGLFEPVLVSLPERDRIAQLVRMGKITRGLAEQRASIPEELGRLLGGTQAMSGGLQQVPAAVA